MIGYRILPFVGMFTALVASAPADAASFACSKAITADERAVCADPSLSKLDGLLPAAMAKAKRQFAEDVTQLDRDFLGDRKTCGSRKPCLTAVYVGLLAQLQTYGAPGALPTDVSAATIAGGDAPPSSAIPRGLGDCATTSLLHVAPRLSSGDGPVKPADFDNGTGVTFANGVVQVSYDRQPNAIASKPHDPVAMCLVWIPHHCPPGDDRGRFYTVTNTRTGQTWTMPDSQHMCGGA